MNRKRLAALAAGLGVAGAVTVFAVGSATGTDRPPKPPKFDPAAEYPVVGPDGTLERNPDGSLKMKRPENGPPPDAPGTARP